MIRLPICQINYAEVNSNYITIHSQQTITLKMTLSEWKKSWILIFSERDVLL